MTFSSSSLPLIQRSRQFINVKSLYLFCQIHSLYNFIWIKSNNFYYLTKAISIRSWQQIGYRNNESSTSALSTSSWWRWMCGRERQEKMWVCVCAKRSSSELNNDKALQRSGQVAKHLQVQVNWVAESRQILKRGWKTVVKNVFSEHCLQTSGEKYNKKIRISERGVVEVYNTQTESLIHQTKNCKLGTDKEEEVKKVGGEKKK